MTGTRDVDLAVVGGGACGMTAALRAAAHGVPSIAIFEKSTRQGCNTQFSSGSLAAGGTSFQAEAGVVDSPQRHAADIMAVSRDPSSKEIVTALCERAPLYVEWLASDLGYPMELGVDMPRSGQSVPRLHTDRGRQGGSRLVGALRSAADRRPEIALVDNCPVVGLLESGDGVCGVTIEEQEGRREIRAGAVVLAADGFGANPEMLEEYCPDAVGRIYGGVSTSTGDAIQWALAVGATVANMGSFLGHGLMIPGFGTRLNPALPFMGAVLVDARGRRFVDETAHGYSSLSNVILRQEGGRAFMVWTEAAMRIAMNSELMRDSKQAGAYRRYENVEEVASKTGIPAETLAATLRYVSFGRDGDGDGPQPFYGSWVTGGILTTQGGVVVDPDGRVQRRAGGVIRHLYAGGGSAAGISGPSSNGYSSGNGLLCAMGFGWGIGEAVAQDARVS